MRLAVPSILGALLLGACDVGGDDGEADRQPLPRTVATTPEEPASQPSPNPERPADVRRIRVGGDPWDIVAAGRYLWIANHNDGTVTRIDARRERKVRPAIRIPQNPLTTSVTAAEGMVWVGGTVGLGDSGTLVSLDQAGGAVATRQATREGVSQVAVAPDAFWVLSAVGRLMRVPRDGGRPRRIRLPNGAKGWGIVMAAGAPWVVLNDGTVVEINPSSGKVRKDFYVGESALGIDADGNDVWVTADTAGTGTLVRIDAKRRTEVGRTPVAEGPSELAVGDDAIWVVHYYASRLTRVDRRGRGQPAEFRYGERLDTDNLPGTNPVTVAEADGKAWVTSRDGVVTVVEPRR